MTKEQRQIVDKNMERFKQAMVAREMAPVAVIAVSTDDRDLIECFTPECMTAAECLRILGLCVEQLKKESQHRSN